MFQILELIEVYRIGSKDNIMCWSSAPRACLLPTRERDMHGLASGAHDTFSR
jgi:hypothetical protein